MQLLGFSNSPIPTCSWAQEGKGGYSGIPKGTVSINSATWRFSVCLLTHCTNAQINRTVKQFYRSLSTQLKDVVWKCDGEVDGNITAAWCGLWTFTRRCWLSLYIASLSDDPCPLQSRFCKQVLWFICWWRVSPMKQPSWRLLWMSLLACCLVYVTVRKLDGMETTIKAVVACSNEVLRYIRGWWLQA